MFLKISNERPERLLESGQIRLCKLLFGNNMAGSTVEIHRRITPSQNSRRQIDDHLEGVE